MSVSNSKILKNNYNVIRTTGDKAMSSDFTFEIEGYEALAYLTKQAPWPILTPGGEIEIPGPQGTAIWQPQQAKIHQQGQLALMENTAGAIDAALISLLASGNGARFNAKIYEGTPDAYTRYKPIVDCFFVADNPDRDWENRAQTLMITGTLFFHYFGETIPGNIAG